HHLSVVPVQVGAADAAVAHAHDDLAGAGGRAGNVLDHELAGRTAENRAHHRRGPRSDTRTSVAFSRARPFRRKQRAVDERPSVDSKNAAVTAFASACWRGAWSGGVRGKAGWHGRVHWVVSVPVL